MRVSVSVLTVLVFVTTSVMVLAEEESSKKEKNSIFVNSLIKALTPQAAQPVVDAVELTVVKKKPEEEKAADFESTHEQVKLIKTVNAENQILKLNTFCLNKEGEILAGCGDGPGEIRVYSEDGEFKRLWTVDVKPEAINVTEEGVILVGGEGKIFKYKSDGEKILETAAPHLASMKDNAEQIREEVVNRNKQRTKLYQQQIDIVQQQIDKLSKKAETEELNSRDERTLKTLERQKKSYERIVERYASQQPTEEQIERQVKAMIASKTRIISISATGDHVFVATPAIKGYGFDVWRTDQLLENSEKNCHRAPRVLQPDGRAGE